MAVPISQMWAVASYVLKQKIKGVKRYPLVMQLEPLFRCNLACAGCGKIQYPAHILKKQLTPEQCWSAAEECGVPVVAIPGGEPMMHDKMPEIVNGLVKMKKYVYVCSNALLLEKRLPEFTPSKFLSFSIHLDGPKDEHDFAVCREGTYQTAISAIKAAVKRGFRVTTNSTLFGSPNVEHYRQFFDETMALGVESMMVSPGYSYQKAPDQEHFMKYKQANELFRSIFANRKKHWQFNQSALFIEFLEGKIDFECTPWGLPTYNIFGWQKPCYLLQEGYVKTFKELMEGTEWDKYGRRSGNDKCKDCMVHCGYEPTSVDYTFSSLKGFIHTARATMANRSIGDHTKPTFVPANRPNLPAKLPKPEPVRAAAD